MKNIEYILTGAEMQQYDKNTVSHFRIPELLLMEQAALGAVEEVVRLFPKKSSTILVLAGKGNNGGDAMAVARLLWQREYKVTVMIIGKQESAFSNSAAIQYEIIKRMNIPIVTEFPSESYDIVMDGIFGVGLNREINGEIFRTISKANEMEGCKIALDIPSGVCATTGNILGISFRADYTITFAFLKRGLCLYPGAANAGNIIKKEIGITTESFLGENPEMYALTGEVKDYLPRRTPAGHKGTFGKVFLIAGSETMGGAAVLAGKAAMLSGCGMLRICTHRNHKSEILTLLPEAIIDVYETGEEAEDIILKGLDWADVIAMGPGMGTGETAEILWNSVVDTSGKPLVLDADGLNLLSRKENYQKLLEKQRNPATRRKLVLTPHPLELSRLLGKSPKEQGENALELTNQLAKEFCASIVKKDARTIICNGGSSYILNLYGNSGMATAGSGDVLTGIIASLLAVCEEPFEAAAIGVFLHSKAGDLAKEQKNEYSLMAGDICQALTEVLK